MGRIRVLPDAVANQIAAGEVVERPASVVKELLENALDAGAASVRIEVEAAGRRLIRVVDDGSGMLRDDALLAFERHATSKLRDVAGLTAICTLGFRGEALPSIASVSRLILETRALEESTGTLVEIHGGKLLRNEESARPRGTTVTVRDLFYNVPARRKFLRTDQTELAHIASVATHYSLAYPAKGFYLIHEGAELLSTPPVGTLRERVYQIFGGEVLEELIELGEISRRVQVAPGPGEQEAVERVFRLQGFVSRPQVQKFNRNSIYLFVNGRLIRDRLLLHALSSAYHNLMPAGCYPFALLFLSCPAEEVDVNVHPTKAEVRFRHSSAVHDFVRDAVRDRLMESRPASQLPAPQGMQRAVELAPSEATQRLQDFSFESVHPEPVEPQDAGQLPVLTVPAPTRLSFSRQAESSQAAAARSAPAVNLEAPVVRWRIPDTHGSLPSSNTMPADDVSLDALRTLRPLGQLQNSFIIAASAAGLWIIDQHVAHERILFEKIVRQSAIRGVEQQRLLLPTVVQLTASQQLQFARIAEELRLSGFDCEPFGSRTLAIQSAPAGISHSDVEKLLFEILESVEAQERQLTLEEIRLGIAASVACRAAIKINTPLDNSKMEWLLEELAATRYPMTCPHGRPIALRYSLREILKAFHRL